MTIGTFVVLVALIAIVAAIIRSWVKAHQQGKHIACDECGGCSSHDPSQGCACADDMLKHVDEALDKRAA